MFATELTVAVLFTSLYVGMMVVISRRTKRDFYAASARGILQHFNDHPGMPVDLKSVSPSLSGIPVYPRVRATSFTVPAVRGSGRTRTDSCIWTGFRNRVGSVTSAAPPLRCPKCIPFRSATP